jgi:hypothetical protein
MDRCSVGSLSSRCVSRASAARFNGQIELPANGVGLRAQAIARQRIVVRGDLQVGTGQHGLHVVEQVPEEGQCASIPASASSPCSSNAAADPLPKPNQPGSMWRLWVHANTHGMARSAANARAAGAHGGPRPDVHALDDVQRRGGAEVFEELRAAESQAAIRLQAARGDGAHRRAPPARRRLVACAVASATAAKVRSRCAWRWAATHSSDSPPRPVRSCAACRVWPREAPPRPGVRSAAAARRRAAAAVEHGQTLMPASRAASSNCVCATCSAQREAAMPPSLLVSE